MGPPSYSELHCHEGLSELGAGAGEFMGQGKLLGGACGSGRSTACQVLCIGGKLRIVATRGAPGGGFGQWQVRLDDLNTLAATPEMYVSPSKN